MADPYRVLLHPDLAKDRADLQASANDMSPTKDADERARDAHRLNQLDKGLDALAEGREAEFAGKRMVSMNLDRHPDLGDCAELKIPVTQHFKKNGQPARGISDRLTYQEAEGTKEDPRPVRRAVAFEPRRGGRPFQVTNARQGRAVGVSIPELDEAKARENATGNEITPVRIAGDTELANSIRAGTNPEYTKGGTVSAPTETPVASNAATQNQTKQQTQLTQGGS
jgi:hypothetical protein